MTTDAHRNRAEVRGGGEATDNGRSHTFRERRKVAKLQILRAPRSEKKYHEDTGKSRDKVKIEQRRVPKVKET